VKLIQTRPTTGNDAAVKELAAPPRRHLVTVGQGPRPAHVVAVVVIDGAILGSHDQIALIVGLEMEFGVIVGLVDGYVAPQLFALPGNVVSQVAHMTIKPLVS
jgi:hypothetical protein